MKTSNSNLATGLVRRLGALILFAAFIGSGVRAGAQGPGSLVWASGTDLPSPRAESVAILAPDNAVLLMGGVSPSGNKVVPRLPNGAAEWTTAPDIDITRIGLGAVRYSTQGILLFGGLQGNEPTDEVLFYDYYFGDSRDAEKMSVGRQQFAFAVDASGRAYAVGGLGEPGELFSSAERYVPAQDTWEAIAPLPASRYGASAVGVGGTHLYVFGGATTSAVQATAYRYSIASDSWETIASLPVGVRNGAAVLSQNRIYVTGGVAASGPVDMVQVYDLATTSLWTLDTPLPAARYGHGVVVDASGKILIAGGYDAVPWKLFQ